MRELLEQNLKRVTDRIARAAESAGRDSASITLVAVTKSVDAETIQALIELGVRDIAENRQQTAADKLRLVPGLQGPGRTTCHFIGPLQRNKAKRVIEMFDVIHSVDSLRLAKELDRRAGELDRRVKVFFEVNVTGEAEKHGLSPAETEGVVAAAGELSHLESLGLMCMAPYATDPEAARPYFKQLAELASDLRARGVCGGSARSLAFDKLSMGMSGDFEVAIACGATHVRVGSALFSSA